jgi:hypothetical protein
MWRDFLRSLRPYSATHLVCGGGNAGAENQSPIFFPAGLDFDGERFGTAPTCLAFSELQLSVDAKNGFASPTGGLPEWTRDVPGEVRAAGAGKAA